MNHCDKEIWNNGSAKSKNISKTQNKLYCKRTQPNRLLIGANLDLGGKSKLKCFLHSPLFRITCIIRNKHTWKWSTSLFFHRRIFKIWIILRIQKALCFSRALGVPVFLFIFLQANAL
jgi:hypothetical protein